MNKFLFKLLQYTHGVFATGLVTLKYYSWFALPVFTALPQINYMQAIGLTSFLFLFQKPNIFDLEKVSKIDQEKPFIKYGGFMLPWVTLFFGFTVKLIIEVLG